MVFPKTGESAKGGSLSGKADEENFRLPVPRANVLGVGVSAINPDQAVQLLLDAAREGRKGYVCVTGVHGVTEAQNDASFRRILNNALLNTPDGMPMTWVGRLQGFSDMDRVYGPDLMLNLSEAGILLGMRHFYYGGRDGVAEDLKLKMGKRFPGLVVAGTYTPPFRPLNAAEEAELAGLVREAAPHFFWVGLSTPKQERFMDLNFQSLGGGIMLGVGAAFDIHAGCVPQAPRWMQRSGLEWLFRLGTEPKRLWKRYLINNPLFLLRITAQLTKLKTHQLA